MKRTDLHNFHVSCPPAWRYNGDVNLEHGGTFFKVADLEAFIAVPVLNDSIEVVRVEDTPWGWWLIESASLYMSPARTLNPPALAKEYGYNLADLEADPLMLAQLQAEFVLGCWGLEAQNPQAVMIGAHEGRAETDQFGRWKLVKDGRQPYMPLTKLPGNARLSNYLRREYLEN